MTTLDLDFGLMLCSREEFSFRNVYVSILVGTKQQCTQKWFKKFRLETPFLDDNVKSKEKRQNFKICKANSLSIFIIFLQFVCLFFIVVTKQLLHYDFGSHIWSKMSFTSAGLKNWRHASTNAAIDHSWFFYPEFLLQCLPHVSWCNNLTIKTWCGESETYKNNC